MAAAIFIYCEAVVAPGCEGVIFGTNNPEEVSEGSFYVQKHGGLIMQSTLNVNNAPTRR